MRTANPDLELNSEHLKANLDLLEEAREDAKLYMEIWAYRSANIITAEFTIDSSKWAILFSEIARPIAHKRKEKTIPKMGRTLSGQQSFWL